MRCSIGKGKGSEAKELRSLRRSSSTGRGSHVGGSKLEEGSIKQSLLINQLPDPGAVGW